MMFFILIIMSQVILKLVYFMIYHEFYSWKMPLQNQWPSSSTLDLRQKAEKQWPSNSNKPLLLYCLFVCLSYYWKWLLVLERTWSGLLGVVPVDGQEPTCLSWDHLRPNIYWSSRRANISRIPHLNNTAGSGITQHVKN